MAELPTFYIEHIWRVHNSPANRSPLWSHDIYKLSNVVPEIKLGLDYYNGSTLGQISVDAVAEVQYYIDQFAANGVTMNRYAFNLFAFGRGTTDHSANLLNHSGDLLPGFPVAGGGHAGNEAYLSPWAASGISINATWAGNFLSTFYTTLVASGMQFPEVWDFTGEESLGDDVQGFIGGGTGWVTKALADPRANLSTHKIDANHTFSQYWNAANTFPNGGGIPPINTGVAVPASNLQKSNNPVNFPIQEKWRAARRRVHNYALYQSFTQIMNVLFGEIPVVEYLSHADSYQHPIVQTPGPSGYGMFMTSGIFNRDWQSFAWYGELARFTNQVFLDDGGTNYDWQAPIPWYAKYPLPSDSIYDQATYAALQRAKAYVYDLTLTAPDVPVAVWVSVLDNNLDTRAMVEFLKYCYNIGVTKFFVWEDGYFIDASPTLYSTWYNIITEVNNYVQSLNHAILRRTGSINRNGAILFKR